MDGATGHRQTIWKEKFMKRLHAWQPLQLLQQAEAVLQMSYDVRS